MTYLIIGGSKSGKSDIAEELSLKVSENRVIYIATMHPYDNEDIKRIENHINRRVGRNFITIEKEKDLSEILNNINEDDTVLLDSVTSLLTNEMFINNNIVYNTSNKIINDITSIIEKAKNTIIVSDYIFNDSLLYDEITNHYRKQLGLINIGLAEKCDNVFECSFGLINKKKSRGIYEKIL